MIAKQVWVCFSEDDVRCLIRAIRELLELRVDAKLVTILRILEAAVERERNQPAQSSPT